MAVLGHTVAKVDEAFGDVEAVLDVVETDVVKFLRVVKVGAQGPAVGKEELSVLLRALGHGLESTVTLLRCQVFFLARAQRCRDERMYDEEIEHCSYTVGSATGARRRDAPL